MSEKVGRNDPCPCGSGKKYKSCCFQSDQQKKTSPFGGRKFTAKVISSGGTQKPPEPAQAESKSKPPVDYTTLMERSFGDAMRTYEDKPPQPANPTQFIQTENNDE